MYEKLHNLKWVDGLLLLGIGLITAGLGMAMKTAGEENNQVSLIRAGITPTGKSADVQGDNKVVIDIAGQVMRPGVFSLKKGSRVNDVLIAAGGLAALADREWVEVNLNRAEILRDGQKIVIPSKNSNKPITNNQANSNNQIQNNKQILGASTGLISINNASVEELDKLPGIGPAIAQRIIDYRDKMGGFKDINEIKLVSGIGEKLYAQIKDKIGL